jgi:hypothetical protein
MHPGKDIVLVMGGIVGALLVGGSLVFCNLLVAPPARIELHAGATPTVYEVEHGALLPTRAWRDRQAAAYPHAVVTCRTPRFGDVSDDSTPWNGSCHWPYVFGAGTWR